MQLYQFSLDFSGVPISTNTLTVKEKRSKGKQIKCDFIWIIRKKLRYRVMQICDFSLFHIEMPGLVD